MFLGTISSQKQGEELVKYEKIYYGPASYGTSNETLILPPETRNVTIEVLDGGRGSRVIKTTTPYGAAGGEGGIYARKYFAALSGTLTIKVGGRGQGTTNAYGGLGDKLSSSVSMGSTVIVATNNPSRYDVRYLGGSGYSTQSSAGAGGGGAAGSSDAGTTNTGSDSVSAKSPGLGSGSSGSGSSTRNATGYGNGGGATTATVGYGSPGVVKITYWAY